MDQSYVCVMAGDAANVNDPNLVYRKHWPEKALLVVGPIGEILSRRDEGHDARVKEWIAKDWGTDGARVLQVLKWLMRRSFRRSISFVLPSLVCIALLYFTTKAKGCGGGGSGGGGGGKVRDDQESAELMRDREEESLDLDDLDLEGDVDDDEEEVASEEERFLVVRDG